MRNNLGSIISRVSTGVTAFVCAGFLVHSILSGNGGSPSSQNDWTAAQTRAFAVSQVDDAGRQTSPDDKPTKTLDQILTGGITPIGAKKEAGVQEEPRQRSEPSVLTLIRENADVAPAVSSGTNRVSVTVKKGDTLFSIARKHGLRMSELAGMNGLKEPYVIKLGQTLYVAR